MLEGKIIKFYREFQGLKQKDLGDGICSSTHISKIERGLTEVSQETIDFLCKRLGIQLSAEIENYKEIEQLLKEWQDAIVKKLKSRVESIKSQLEGYNLLHMQDFYRLYTLILARYYLFVGEGRMANGLIGEMSAWTDTDMTPYEKNLLLHVTGVYHLSVKNNYVEALACLKEINLEHYPNQEYYYDLALTYHSLNSRVLAFFHANKALQYFTKIRSFSRIIESEMLMVIQLEQSEDHPTLSNEYHRLIDMTEDYGLDHQKAMLYHNVAYLYLRNAEYHKASQYYKKSMDAREKSHPNYLGSFEGYVNALTKEGKISKEKLLLLVEQGLSLSQASSATTFIHIFTMHYYYLSNQTEKYYEYLEKEAFPYFKEMGYMLLVEHYTVVLFDYYMGKNDMDKANSFAGPVINKFRRNNQFV
ncbi:helix-turn-helix transcriptional regulator [Sutcliffiella horikoshii]|uniref:Helix-turn-helix transcriptional regulator n=1 Tax=Sutcliffiella horikoshii TaxID=79883 RepID=A0A5D4SW35_9BACI|nr:helix-turn-helix transcriptional regulator [Sutcliffiella horikoshii]TYS67613.1 helix-turn-helix transcriptional regulator [Sutcliffiella horikoshii]